MDRAKVDGIHSDIAKQYTAIEDAKSDCIAASHKKHPMQKYSRLASEFEQINDVANAEKNYVNQLILGPNDAKKWSDYANFCLRNDLQLKAEECLNR
jgi:hypothetical protein